MPTSDHTPTLPAPWIPFLGPALRVRRHALGLRALDVNTRLLQQGGKKCNVLRYEGAVVSSVFGPVATPAEYIDLGFLMMVRLSIALEWSVPQWIKAARTLRRQHEAAIKLAAKRGLTRATLLADLKAGLWRSPT